MNFESVKYFGDSNKEIYNDDFDDTEINYVLPTSSIYTDRENDNLHILDDPYQVKFYTNILFTDSLFKNKNINFTGDFGTKSKSSIKLNKETQASLSVKIKNLAQKRKTINKISSKKKKITENFNESNFIYIQKIRKR